jgi:hypothetical protein
MLILAGCSDPSPIDVQEAWLKEHTGEVLNNIKPCWEDVFPGKNIDELRKLNVEDRKPLQKCMLKNLSAVAEKDGVTLSLDAFD